MSGNYDGSGLESQVQLPDTIADCHELIKRLIEITDALVLRVGQLEQENKALK